MDLLTYIIQFFQTTKLNNIHLHYLLTNITFINAFVSKYVAFKRINRKLKFGFYISFEDSLNYNAEKRVK